MKNVLPKDVIHRDVYVEVGVYLGDNAVIVDFIFRLTTVLYEEVLLSFCVDIVNVFCV